MQTAGKPGDKAAHIAQSDGLCLQWPCPSTKVITSTYKVYILQSLQTILYRPLLPWHFIKCEDQCCFEQMDTVQNLFSSLYFKSSLSFSCSLSLPLSLSLSLVGEIVGHNNILFAGPYEQRRCFVPLRNAVIPLMFMVRTRIMRMPPFC